VGPLGSIDLHRMDSGISSKAEDNPQVYIEDGLSSGRKRLVHCLPCLWQSAQVIPCLLLPPHGLIMLSSAQSPGHNEQREHLRTATFSKPPVFAAQLEVEPKPK